MKKIVFLIMFGLTIISCDVDQEETYTYEVNPVYAVDMPTAFRKDSITNIPVSFKRPSTCHLFTDFYYEIEGLNRNVAIQTIKVNQDNCQVDTENIYNRFLKFKPAELATYHFKFWTGTNTQGVDQYIEYDVVVDH
jgi:hypothetical protein